MDDDHRVSSGRGDIPVDDGHEVPRDEGGVGIAAGRRADGRHGRRREGRYDGLEASSCIRTRMLGSQTPGA